MSMDVTQEMLNAYNDARALMNREQREGRPPASGDEKVRAGLLAALDVAAPHAYAEALNRVRSLLSIGYGDAFACIRQAEQQLGIEVRP